MRLLLLLAFLLQFSFLYSQSTSPVEKYIELSIEELNEDKDKVHYSLSEIVSHIEDSIKKKKKITILPNSTAFEKALVTARRIQHNDSQLVAIRILKFLLEFEYYRTKGEELYIRLLIGTSLDYIGAPIIANNYINHVFPNMLEEMEDPITECFLLNHYANHLIRIDSFATARDIYKYILQIYQEEGDSTAAYNTRNNLGYVLQRSKQYDSAKYYYKINQDPSLKNLSPVIYAFSFGNYGVVLFQENFLDSAISYYKKEIRLLRKIPSEVGMDNTYIGLGEAFQAKKQLDSAVYFYKQALQISKKHKNYNSIVRSYEHIMQLYFSEKGASELSVLLNNYIQYNDSLSSLVAARTIRSKLQISEFLEIFQETEDFKQRYDQLKTFNSDLVYAIIALSSIVFLLIILITVRNKGRHNLKVKNTELKEKNAELNKSYQTISETNTRNGILLKELHHRVKNNLQVISSLFNLQVNVQDLDKGTVLLLREAQDRIHSISLIHKKIYQSDDIDRLDFSDYLRTFSAEMKNIEKDKVIIDFQVPEIIFSIDSAIPLGLIFNELFTNSAKHASPDNKLSIAIKYESDNGLHRFIYTDNGKGINANQIEEEHSSIGITLIKLLAKQLEAEITFKPTDNDIKGFWFSIEGNFS